MDIPKGKIEIQKFLRGPPITKASRASRTGGDKNQVALVEIQQVQAVLESLTAVVSSGSSIAAATDYAACTIKEAEPIRNAMRDIPRSELRWWGHYCDGKVQLLPTIDWSDPKSREPEPTNSNPKRLAAWRRRADALSRLYKRDEKTALQPGHAVWFTKQHVIRLPLVKAMERVIGAERNLNGGAEGLSAVQMADLQTTNAVLSASSKFLTGAGSSAPSEVAGSIQCSQMMLGRHRNMLRGLLRGAGKAQTRKLGSRA